MGAYNSLAGSVKGGPFPYTLLHTPICCRLCAAMRKESVFGNVFSRRNLQTGVNV